MTDWNAEAMSEAPDKEGNSPLMAMRLAQTRSEAKMEQLVAMVGELKSDLKELKSTFATKERVEVIEGRLKKIEEWNTWLVRIILGGFVAAVCAIVYAKGGVPAP
jgi:hypothetical protein